MKLKTFVSTLASVLLIGSQVAYADKWSDQFPHIAATGDIPGMCSYEETSKKDYSGRTLTINTHAIPVMGEPTALHAEQFEKLTGAKEKLLILLLVTYIQRQWSLSNQVRLLTISSLVFLTSSMTGRGT